MEAGGRLAWLRLPPHPRRLLDDREVDEAFLRLYHTHRAIDIDDEIPDYDDYLIQLGHRAIVQSAAPSDLRRPSRPVTRDMHTLMTALFRSDEAIRPFADDLPAPYAAADIAAIHSTPSALYEQLRQLSHVSPRPLAELGELPGLKPTLRAYQRDAVAWMCARERAEGAAQPIGDESFWKSLRCPGGVVLHWNMFNGALTLGIGAHGDAAEQERPSPPTPPPFIPAWRVSVEGLTPTAPERKACLGGILADEMGLGKTVEVIALLLAHRRPDELVSPPPSPAGPPAAENPMLPCICGGQPSECEGTYVGCDTCGRWVHDCCAGFETVAEVEKEGADYHCMHCACAQNESSPRATGATLLVCPAAILGQWRHEVERHVLAGGMRVSVYPGMATALKTPHRLASIHPHSLGAADLVLCSIETLRSELDFAPQGDTVASRLSGWTPRFPVSPLIGLHWWRLVVDEAQMVESDTAKAAAMAMKLHATNRWAVSGTPMGRGRLADLHGLLSFLQLEPWSERAVWQHMIERPIATLAAAVAAGDEAEEARWVGAAEQAHCMLLQLLHSVMWRNSKRSVISQLEIPPQSTRTHMLVFSSIERHFYNKQHLACAKAASDALRLFRKSQRADGSSTTTSADSASPVKAKRELVFGSPGRKSGSVAAHAERALEKLTPRILRLRQACCHPQLGQFGIKRLGMQSSLAEPLSMRLILSRLLEDEKNRCEEEMRKVVLDLSALGAIHSEACAHYIDALTTIDAFRVPSPLMEPGLQITVVGPPCFRDMTVQVEAQEEAAPPAAPPAEPKRHAADNPLGPLEWEMGGDETRDLWLRLEASKPVRLSQIQIQLEPHAEGGPLLPHRCSLWASTGGEGSGVFVQVVEFVVAAAGGSDEEGLQSFQFYRPSKAKQYLLNIHSVHPPLSPLATRQAATVRIARLTLMEATIEIDYLQLLHVAHNLGQALRVSSPAPALTERKIEDDTHVAAPYFTSSLTTDGMLLIVDRVHSQLVGERSAAASAQRSVLQELRGRINAARKAGGGARFWARLAAEVEARPHLGAQLHDKLVLEPTIRGDAAAAAAESASAAVRWCGRMVEEGEALRDRLLSGLDALPARPSAAEVAESGNCGKCRVDWMKVGPECRHCKLERVYEEREKYFFSYRRQRKVSEATLQARPGDDAGAAASNVGDAFMEECSGLVMLRSIARWTLMVARDEGLHDKGLQQLAAVELDELPLLKRELRVCRDLWMSYFNLLSQLDELNSATSTMTLTDSLEEKAALPEIERHTLVGSWEYADRKKKYELELVCARAELKKAKAQLAYLRRVAASGNAASSECPVCFQFIAEERIVSSCAHSVCVNCAEEIRKRRSGKFVCPLCQQEGTPSQATALQWADGSCAGTAVKGSWGTKVTAVVEQVMNLPQNDKCLIFSWWEDMLSLIDRALKENGVQFARIHSQAKLEATLTSFRQRPEIRALLLPLSRGANGLNLVEAQHVFLVEPLLNPAVEAQAIGRVHRMSQLRQTTVHRFIVAGTVEEAIHKLRTGDNEEGDIESASPNKKAKRVEEAKTLTWEQLQCLFNIRSTDQNGDGSRAEVLDKEEDTDDDMDDDMEGDKDDAM
ncbi:hypothetical protein AB1Y20_003252 [Prymnesium parvum]|uniref:Anaphase-promoting complex subunit 11 n=1 Tax=Prymnesium parvum TaxID=97485 RepID=A0AB34JD71_PRYPA